MKPNTQLILEESKYFLDTMQETTTEAKKCLFNYHAFLSASFCTLDTLLVEGAVFFELQEYYKQNYHEIPNKIKRLEEKYLYLATKLRKERALEFFNWIVQKYSEPLIKKLRKDRNKAVHEGETPVVPKPFNIILPDGHFNLKGLTEYEEFKKEITPCFEECEKGYLLMKSIVDEAHSKFN